MRLNGSVGFAVLILVAVMSVGIADVTFADTAQAAEVATPSAVATPAQTTTVPTPAAPQSNEKFWLVVFGTALTIIVLAAIVMRRSAKQTQ